MGQRGNFLLYNIKNKHLWTLNWYTSKSTTYRLLHYKLLLIKDLLQTLVHFNWQQIWTWYQFNKVYQCSLIKYKTLRFHRNLQAFMLQIKLYQFNASYCAKGFIINFKQLTQSFIYKYIIFFKTFSQLSLYLNFKSF